jgi:hypothetical protein
LPGGATVIRVYPDSEIFPGYRTISQFEADEFVGEIPIAGDSVAAQQANLQILAESMSSGKDALAGKVADVLNLEYAGYTGDDTEVAAALINDFFAEADTLIYDSTLVCNTAGWEGVSCLLDIIEQAGSDLLVVLGL